MNPHVHLLVLEPTISVPGGGAVSDNMILLFQGVQINQFLGDFTVNHFAVRRFNHAELVNPSVVGQVENQTYPRTFRRVNRTDATVVRSVNIAHFQTRALASQAAGPERRERPQMFHLAQNVLLIHKLRELVGGEKFFQSRLERPRRDEVNRQRGGRINR